MLVQFLTYTQVLKFQNPTIKSTSYYKLKKARIFFKKVQNETFLRPFSITPSTIKPLNLDLSYLSLYSDSSLEKILKKLDLTRTKVFRTTIKKNIKEKTIYFRNFIETMADDDNKLDLDIIKDKIARKAREAERIRIRD